MVAIEVSTEPFHLYTVKVTVALDSTDNDNSLRIDGCAIIKPALLQSTLELYS